jgi:hypothetical protein
VQYRDSSSINTCHFLHFQTVYAPDPDPNMTIEHYDRTWEQNENLGINDMKTENYGEEQDQDNTAVTTCAMGQAQGKFLEAESAQHRLYVRDEEAGGGGGGVTIKGKDRAPLLKSPARAALAEKESKPAATATTSPTKSDSTDDLGGGGGCQ